MFRKKSTKDPIEILKNAPGLWHLNPSERSLLTKSCRDTDYIKKVKGAGTVKKINGQKVQTMHDGSIVVSGGYHGEWMQEVIRDLKGHHEPQEEKVFYEVLQKVRQDSWMIELGSFWAYYSIWFNRQIKGAKNICCEPDPSNLELGKVNAELNSVNMNFVHSAAGSNDGQRVDIVMDSDNSRTVNVPIRTVDSLVEEYAVDRLEMLHIDVQGFEYDALRGCVETIRANKLRFVFISTHHYVFSNNPNTHQECLDFVVNHGGYIISSHTVPESFSGDGLIVASFNERDKDFQVPTSIAHTDRSLFRPSDLDLKILMDEMRGHIA